MSVTLVNLWSIFLKGGPVMWPLLALSILSITIIIDKWFTLIQLNRIWFNGRGQIFSLVKEFKLKEAIGACENLDMFIARVLKTGVLKYGASRETILTVMEQSLLIETNDLKKRMGILATIVNLAPLLGLLATIVGLTAVFHAVHMRSNALNPLSLGDMSSGIWQALVATSAGLAVGIIAFVGHAFLAEQINHLIMEAKENMQTLSNVLYSLWEGENAGQS